MNVLLIMIITKGLDVDRMVNFLDLLTMSEKGFKEMLGKMTMS